MTRVEKLFSSHFRISQQFFKEDTPGSLVDNADWLLHGQNEFSEFSKRNSKPGLEGHEHEMDPGPGMTTLHGIEGGLVEAMLASSLTGKVEFSVLLPLSLLDCELDGQGELDANALHVGLDLVQVLLTEVLDGVPHGERLKDGNPVLVPPALRVRSTLRDVATI